MSVPCASIQPTSGSSYGWNRHVLSVTQLTLCWRSSQSSSTSRQIYGARDWERKAKVILKGNGCMWDLKSVFHSEGEDSWNQHTALFIFLPFLLIWFALSSASCLPPYPKVCAQWRGTIVYQHSNENSQHTRLHFTHHQAQKIYFICLLLTASL